MKIVLAAGIYPPEIGGPSFYAASLKESLEKLGHTTEVVSHTQLRKLPPGIRHVWYAVNLFLITRRCDAIIAFDTFAAGVPAVLVARMRNVPVFVRIGGDAVWESYVERTHELLPLPHIYRVKEKWNWKERLMHRANRFVLMRATPVFSSAWLLPLWQAEYGFDLSRARVIENAFEPKLESIAPTKKNFMLYTREIALKNHEAFRRAFAKAKETHPDIELEEGTLAHGALLEKMRSCYAVVLPSISEITPNYIIEAVRCGKPFLLTKYSGYATRFPGCGMVVDPLDESDMMRGIEALGDSAQYETMRKNAEAFSEIHTYDDIAREYISLVEKHL